MIVGQTKTIMKTSKQSTWTALFKA